MAETGGTVVTGEEEIREGEVVDGSMELGW